MKTLCSKPSETSHFTQNEVQKLGPAKLHIIFMIPPPPPVLPTFALILNTPRVPNVLLSLLTRQLPTLPTHTPNF